MTFKYNVEKNEIVEKTTKIRRFLSQVCDFFGCDWIWFVNDVQLNDLQMNDVRVVFFFKTSPQFKCLPDVIWSQFYSYWIDWWWLMLIHRLICHFSSENYIAIFDCVATLHDQQSCKLDGNLSNVHSKNSLTIAYMHTA